MRPSFSIPQMLAELQSQIAYHRKQGEHHARQEAFHREKTAFHAAELQTAEERCAAFEAASAAAGELVERHRSATAPAAPPDDMPDWKKRPVGRLVARVVESQRPEEIFSPSQIAQEVNRHYGAKLRQKVDGRAVSVTLAAPRRRPPPLRRPPGNRPSPGPLLEDPARPSGGVRRASPGQRALWPADVARLHPLVYTICVSHNLVQILRTAGAPRNREETCPLIASAWPSSRPPAWP